MEQIFVDRPTLAKKFNVSTQTILSWENEGMPVARKEPGKSGKKWYSEEDATNWYIANKEADTDMQEIERRKKLADAVLAELKTLRFSYKYVDINLVLSIYREQAENISAKLKTLSTIIASNISDVSTYAERNDIVETEIIELLRLLTVDKNTAEDWKRIAMEADTE